MQIYMLLVKKSSKKRTSFYIKKTLFHTKKTYFYIKWMKNFLVKEQLYSFYVVIKDEEMAILYFSCSNVQIVRE